MPGHTIPYAKQPGGTEQALARLLANIDCEDETMPMLWFLPMILLSAMLDMTPRPALAKVKSTRRKPAGGLST